MNAAGILYFGFAPPAARWDKDCVDILYLLEPSTEASSLHYQPSLIMTSRWMSKLLSIKLRRIALTREQFSCEKHTLSSLCSPDPDSLPNLWPVNMECDIARITESHDFYDFCEHISKRCNAIYIQPLMWWEKASLPASIFYRLCILFYPSLWG